MYKSLDNGYEVRAVFVDIYQAFDKLWHLGLYYKLKQNGISSKLLNTLKHRFSREQNNLSHGLRLKHEFLKDYFLHHSYF